MTTSITGTIKAVTGDGKRFKLDNDEWYGVYSASMLKAKVGDMVGFDYASVEKAGRTFHNVKGSISILSSSPIIMASSGVSGPTFSRPEAILPVHMSKDRCIIRQNSLTNAVAYCSSQFQDEEVSIQRVIEVAREFEAYSTGDADIAEAKLMAEAGLTSSATES